MRESQVANRSLKELKSGQNFNQPREREMEREGDREGERALQLSNQEAIPLQFRCNSAAIPLQFRCKFAAIPLQFRCNLLCSTCCVGSARVREGARVERTQVRSD